ncbi:MAG: electron transfer flavoprotein subunit alpha/FixB family protein, partial [Acidimicrobiia bacterium]
WSILPRPTGPDMVAPSGGVIVATDAAIPPEHAAEALTSQVQRESPIAILAPNTSWGREVAARLATKLGLGVITDVTSYSIEDRQVIATRPARSGLTTARIEALTSPVVLLARSQPFDSAELIVGIGRGLGHEHLAELTALARSANAALVASRKVTDAGWLPRSVQIGVTGTFVAPPVYLALGTSGRFNHSSGFRAAAYVLAANIDPNAEIFAHADIGMVGDAMELARAFLATENR